MPSFTSVVLLALSAVGTLALPSFKRDGGDYQNCMSHSDASQVASLYGELIANYTSELADAILAPQFIDYSESVNSLIDSCPQGAAAISLPLMDPTFSSRKMFETGQGQQLPINFQQLNIWPACNTVIIRWLTTNTVNATDSYRAVKPVAGLIVMETNPAPAGSQYPYQINTVYSEFDAAAWLQNLQGAGICVNATAPLNDPTAAKTPANTANAIMSGIGVSATVTASVTPTPVVVTETDATTVVTYTTATAVVTASS